VLLLVPYAVLLRQHLRGQASRRATGLGLASYLVAELLMVVYLMPAISMGATERDVRFWVTMLGWPLCLLLAYAAAYSMAVDTTPSPVAVRAVVAE